MVASLTVAVGTVDDNVILSVQQPSRPMSRFAMRRVAEPPVTV
jgi:hypothetical protein